MKSRFIRFAGIALAIILAAVLSAPSAALADSLNAHARGDVNGDGEITIADYTQCRLHILDLKTLTGQCAAACDANEDGEITIADYTLMRLHILGLRDIGTGGGLPLAGRLIGIDPGHQRHGNYDQELISPSGTETKAKVSSGTQGRFTGIPEFELNLEVALLLRTKLQNLGASVIMTRTTHDVDISNAERAVMMNDANVDCWLRIHADGSSDASKHGMSYLVPAAGCMNTSDASMHTKSVDLANDLIAASVAATGAYNRGVIARDDQTGFCWSSVPVCTVEMGYMTNEAEDNLMATDAYKEKLAQGMADGFADYFE